MSHVIIPINIPIILFQGIHENASKWLVKNRNISGVGIDTMSIDYGQSKTYPSHHILYKENIFGLENVANLDKLPETGYIVYALPMKIGRGSGAPVRIFATKKQTVINGVNTATSSALFAVVLAAMATLHVI